VLEGTWPALQLVNRLVEMIEGPRRITEQAQELVARNAALPLRQAFGHSVSQGLIAQPHGDEQLRRRRRVGLRFRQQLLAQEAPLTGLGLAISKRLAGMLGGDLVVRSKSGAGSVFTVWVQTGPLAGIPRISFAAALRTSRVRRPRDQIFK
jgi:hypothetical protein